MSSDLPARSDDFCYRHKNRRSFVLCQRCGRTICPDCQITAPVGFQCPDCVRNAQRAVRQPATRRVSNWFKNQSSPITYILIGLNLAIFLLQLAVPVVTDTLLYAGIYTEFLSGFPFEPWRMLTSAFLHSTGGFYHILMNMLSLFLLGGPLEQLLGKGRFIALYLVSAFGGSVAVQLLENPLQGVVGASGAIFGLLAAMVVMQKSLSGAVSQNLIGVVVLNLLIGFMIPNISWQAHIGGFITGLAIAWVYAKFGRRFKKRAEKLLVAGIAGLLILIMLVLAIT